MTVILLQSLLCLPQLVRSDYDHLVAYPNLVFEQLLMNMKVGNFCVGHTFQINVVGMYSFRKYFHFGL